ncbi:hypothetical protein [Rhodococcoides fascians]|uniref:hypothetical protein n=1 Tax=Rhodococcoides fascians TaxID=1828 RepID=UPI00050C60B5|nr:hypothetical protein [Rhodococcus fascians]
MNKAVLAANDHFGIEARARVLDIVAEINSAWHTFDTFDVQRTYERKGYRNAAISFVDPHAAKYGEMKTRISIVLEIDEAENPALSTLVEELTDAELSEARAAAVKDLEASNAAAAAAQARLDHLDSVSRQPTTDL